MNREETLQTILSAGLVAVVRCPDPRPLVNALPALVEGGVSVIEVTLTVPNALQVISEAHRELGHQVLIGAGTVLEVDTAKAALDAGANFIVSPIINMDVITHCVMNEVVVMPGAFSPTEVLAAWNAGSDIVKVFPAGSVGPGFFKAIKGPLPQIRLMPTGGVDLSTARAFLEAGAVCLGVGSQLVDQKLLAAADYATLKQRASQFSKIIADFRANRDAPKPKPAQAFGDTIVQ